MTIYQGGKQRLGKKIHSIILKVENDIDKQSKTKRDYFEPMIGMAGVMIHFAKEDDRKLNACDANKDLILMWKALQDGWKPPLKCDENSYNKLKKSTKHSATRGFIGIVASWGGNFFHAYRLKYEPIGRDFLKDAYRKLMKILPAMKNVKFLRARSFDKHSPKRMTIYCDPPYKDNRLSNKEYFNNFDHDKFWNVVRKWSRNNIVIVSEWTAPSDFKKLCKLNSCITNNAKTSKQIDEYLYVHKSTYDKLSNSVKRSLSI